MIERTEDNIIEFVDISESELIIKLRRLYNCDVIIKINTIYKISSWKQLESEIAYLSKSNNLIVTIDKERV